MSLLTDEQVALAKDAVDKYPGEVVPFPKNVFDEMFADFEEDQRKKIAFEFGYLMISSAKSCYNKALATTGSNSDLSFALGDYVGSVAVGFFTLID